MKVKTIKDFDFKGKRVLVRCDFNVPFEGEKILDDFRIRVALPTLNYLREKKAKIILISHLGDPEGKVIEELRLDKVAKHLEKLIGDKVEKLDSILGKEVKEKVFSLKDGEILMLENIRFDQREQKNDFEFAKELAKLGQFFVNEAFSVSHRAHATVVSLPKILPSFIGFLFEKEIRVLENFLKNYQKPLVALIGGKKVKDKAKLIQKFSEIADFVFVNHLIKKELEKEKIKLAKTIFWNGPFGRIEKKEYQRGTEEIVRAILESKAFSLIGGGETIEFTNYLGVTQKFSFASTGGGAMLKFLAGEKLPGLEVLGYYGD